ncbi:MAG TPA: nucleotidyltransferase family protein [Fimbriimonadaceae bacterium]|nr:nucleotidyltransferase family protein [Fimbriimonadaceae bacterium]
MTVRAIVLAAGLSTRAGTGSKLALPWGDGTLLDAALRPLETVGLRGVLVWSNQAPRVGVQWTLVENEHPELGILASLHRGLEAIFDADAVLVSLGDMPFQAPATLAAILRASSADGIVVPTHGERMGNPVVWGRHWFEQLLSRTGNSGAKSLILENLGSVTRVEVGHPIELDDVDTRDDYERLRPR